MKRANPFRLLTAFALALGVSAFASPASAEEKSLLSADGTLYQVEAGLAADLGVAGADLAPDDYVIEWAARRQDGSVRVGIVPGTEDYSVKRNLDLAFDEASQSLLLLWKEEVAPLNVLQLGILRDGEWTTSILLPNLGFSSAFNPQMRLSHSTVRWNDADGRPVTHNRSILSIVWWEESQYALARYAPIFLDEEGFDLSKIAVYDLPLLVGPSGPTTYGDAPPAAYLFPSLHSDGPAGAILASFADLHTKKNFVVRITFPTDLGNPGNGNVTWMRRHIPIVGVVGESPLAPTAPVRVSSMGTTIGSSYRPTFHWRDGNRLLYTRYDGREWASPKAIPLDETMSYERALALVVSMATSN
ncbi:MAG TPA: hypothetical protein VNC59_10095 [Thermoanaerobaculia bacterium]|nr:hypothetical protein [Thermoanaerobaculia bacterium]